MKNVKQLKQYLKNTRAIWICALLGVVIFILIYGFPVLNPTYTDWLLTSEDGDLTQHYLGWKFYRHAPWRFPLGLLDTLAAPNLTSVIFTDSIPLFAVFFKVFRFLLPADFQYFGWWGVMCFALQGALGAGLARKYVKHDISVVAAGLLFVLSPVFIDRMYWMTALAGHFLCLLGLLYLVYYDEFFFRTKRAVLAWGLLGTLCGSIHLYFLPMCGVILLGFLLVDFVRGKKKWKAFLPLVSYLLSAVAAIFLLGGFGSGMKAGNDGLGYYSFNLNGFFNPQGWSTFLKDRFVTDSQYEGFGYLGLGVLVLLFCAVCIFLGNSFVSASKMGKESFVRRFMQWCRLHVERMAFILIILLLTVLAASHVVMFDETILLEAKLPKAIYNLWSVFRASGRLIWPVVYLLLLSAVGLDAAWIRPRAKGVLLVSCLALQLADIRGMLAQKNDVYNKVDQYQTLLPSDFWVTLADQTDIWHICFVSDVANSRRLLFSFGDYASDYGLTLSNFYFPRSLGELERQAVDKALSELPEDTLFVFFDNEAQKALAYDMNYYEVDGLIVGCPGVIPGIEPLAREKLSGYRFRMEDSRYLNNAESTGEGWVIHSYGNSYGPYLNAQPGRYRVKITGSDLLTAQVKCYYNNGDIQLEPEGLVLQEGQISYEIELGEAANDLEFALWNTGEKDMYVSGMEISKQ